jgi:hypothetical protein
MNSGHISRNVDRRSSKFVRRFIPAHLIMLAPAILASACTSPLPAAAPPSESSPQDIIGGFNATDPRLDGTGSLVITYPSSYGYPFPPEEFCTAALISPESVLTAKHCAAIIPIAARYGVTVSYAVGPNSSYPRQMVEVVAAETAPGDRGGFVDYGRDVAVVHLDHPLLDAPTVAVGALVNEDIGQPFAAIGYGVQDNGFTAGTRRLGKQTLRAREGKVFEIMFGSFERFYTWWQTGVVAQAANAAKQPLPAAPASDGGAPSDAAPPPDASVDGGGYPTTPEAYARLIYDTTLLDPGYEVVTGGAAGDAQPCYGDSGGPLVKRVDGQFVSYGVVSGGIGSIDSVCDMGTVYASFGPESLAFIERAKAWVDPCGDMNSTGSCDGEIARRCTNASEGRRRVVDFDCSLVGLECNTAGGQVACGGNVLAPPPPPMPPGKAPSFRALADNAFRAGMLKLTP